MGEIKTFLLERAVALDAVLKAKPKSSALEDQIEWMAKVVAVAEITSTAIKLVCGRKRGRLG